MRENNIEYEIIIYDYKRMIKRSWIIFVLFIMIPLVDFFIVYMFFSV